MSRPLTYTTSYRSLQFNIIKWILISFAILNILSSIWVGIYVEMVVRRANHELPNDDGHYGTGDYGQASKIWKGFIIAVLVVIDLANLVGIYGAYKENYRITLIYGVVVMAYAVFCAVSDYIRGSYSSWVVALSVALLAFLFTHKIRTEATQPVRYSSPSSDPSKP
ncbi:uncharacterized protein LOC128964393 [Oppia nitens]|uniref:uncharacterized protein LOC128964393 n=1 Tax=Oppia nitens TaxID=1686743 RepID=UPI0023D97BFE|nr:uncharacterized protein LOC128964393 [Oppia nitens]